MTNVNNLLNAAADLMEDKIEETLRTVANAIESKDYKVADDALTDVQGLVMLREKLHSVFEAADSPRSEIYRQSRNKENQA